MGSLFSCEPRYPNEPMPTKGELDPHPRYWQAEIAGLRKELEEKIRTAREELNTAQSGQGQEKARILLPEFSRYFDFMLGWLSKRGADIEADPIASTRNSKLEMLLEDILEELVAIRSNLYSPMVNTTMEFDNSTKLPDYINDKTAEVARKLVDLGVDEADLGQFQAFLAVEVAIANEEPLNNSGKSGKISSSLAPKEVLGEDSLIPLEEL